MRARRRPGWTMGKRLSGLEVAKRPSSWDDQALDFLLALTLSSPPPRFSRQVLENPDASVVALGGRFYYAQFCPLAQTNLYHARTCAGPDADDDGDSRGVVYDDTSFGFSCIGQVTPDNTMGGVVRRSETAVSSFDDDD